MLNRRAFAILPFLATPLFSWARKPESTKARKPDTSALWKTRHGRVVDFPRVNWIGLELTGRQVLDLTKHWRAQLSDAEREKYLLFAQGSQWDGYVLRERAAHRRPALTENRILPMVAHMLTRARHQGRPILESEIEELQIAAACLNADAQRIHNLILSSKAEMICSSGDPANAEIAYPRADCQDWIPRWSISSGAPRE